MSESSEHIEFDDELRRYALADPFMPFEIITSGGDHYEVTGPLQLAMNLTTVVLLLPRTGTQIIRKPQITAVHVRETA